MAALYPQPAHTDSRAGLSHRFTGVHASLRRLLSLQSQHEVRRVPACSVRKETTPCRLPQVTVRRGTCNGTSTTSAAAMSGNLPFLLAQLATTAVTAQWKYCNRAFSRSGPHIGHARHVVYISGRCQRCSFSSMAC
ncbi:hypothetical protein DOTSEDRAFT_73352 [Dothistroma septosporum NZE10]|uniref:Uncharacterized protein n=1 Tax=Dothistroma septosporum (strain NZE10 / CBS 128990) TaxID=675120 RepID=N1PLQ1_DOTSN|nr:hypothetical protein DOTSEDRAFT_73352 [Dothistroma septosporum NZE10]